MNVYLHLLGIKHLTVGPSFFRSEVRVLEGCRDHLATVSLGLCLTRGSSCENMPATQTRASSGVFVFFFISQANHKSFYGATVLHAMCDQSPQDTMNTEDHNNL